MSENHDSMLLYNQKGNAKSFSNSHDYKRSRVKEPLQQSKNHNY
jgi:hypothetical protein